jgi:hypothetical protein
MTENAPELLDVLWFNSGKGIVGVAAVQTEPTVIKFYICPVDGFNEVIDANLVMSHGAAFPEVAGYALFGITETTI